MAEISKDPLKKVFEGQLNSVCRANPVVNAQRAQFSGTVKLVKNIALETTAEDLIQTKSSPAYAMSKAAVSREGNISKSVKKDNDASTNEIAVTTFAYLSDENARFRHPSLTARRGRIVTLTGTPDQLRDAATHENIRRMQLARTVKAADPLTESFLNDKPASSKNALKSHDLNRHGKGTLIGIIDVGGFDFSHPDFISPETENSYSPETRFIGIWDQGGDYFDPPPNKSSIKNKERNYGSYISHAHLRTALKQARASGMPATEIVPQSQMQRASHATHVASIAAGRDSFASEALIAGVLISLPHADQDSRKSFYDTTRIVHALEFLFDLADSRDDIDSITINISLGTNGGPHDSSAPMSRWIDNALTNPGRCVTVAAGNSGQQIPRFGGDLGYVMGRIHTSGHIASQGLIRQIEWVVTGDGREDISENELEIWYAPQDRFKVQIKPPNHDWFPVVSPNTHMQNVQLPSGTFVSIYSELYDSGNAHNRISIYLSPLMGKQDIRGVSPGVWKIRLIGETIRDGRYHAWIERDDPVKRGMYDGRTYWSFPSCFSENSFVDECSISTLACGLDVIAVANLDEVGEKINISSSQGPTRDGRQKPDIAAPGTKIWAANGFDPQFRWVAKTGTSMAAPFICSVTAAMLSVYPGLTAAQIQGIIRRTSRPLPERSYDWQNDAGFGVISPVDCLKEAEMMSHTYEIEPETV